jgi:hypothetical protein
MLPMTVDLEKIALEYNDVNDWVQKNPDILKKIFKAKEESKDNDKNCQVVSEN